jgi:trehalose/maltose hydrolase-like predicted phosphorylase
MIAQSAFPVEPWAVRETRFDLDLLAQSESLFAFSNCHNGQPRNHHEREPHGKTRTKQVGINENPPLP